MAFDLRIDIELPAPVPQVMHLLTDVLKIRAWSGAAAVLDNKEGGAFSMFDGAVTGKVLQTTATELSYTWHEDGWGEDVAASVVRISLKPAGEHTSLTLTQEQLPEGVEPAEVKTVWYDEFFVPLEDYIMAFD